MNNVNSYRENLSYTASSYRFGFNGQEVDGEVAGAGNSVVFKYRIHDPRLGRFLSVDPLAKEYPWNSTYAFAENKVVQFIELEGTEIALPRIFIPRPAISIPRLPLPPTHPIPPVMPLPPQALPQSPSAPVPPVPLTSPWHSEQYNWDTYDPTDVSTWPTPPRLEGQGELQDFEPPEGTRNWKKSRKLGHRRLRDEKGRLYRPHKPDEHHPKGHWDILEPNLKRGGYQNMEWENYTPDGVKIPKGKIWGKDCEIPSIILPQVEISVKRPTPSDGAAWDRYKTNMMDRYNSRKFNRQLRRYERKYKRYMHKMEKYNKEMKEYYENCNCTA